jgi:hypothetical protein
MHNRPLRRTLLSRVGAGSLGLIFGLPLGLIVALVATLFSRNEQLSFATWVFSTGGAFFGACFLFPNSALKTFPWLVYFLLGSIPNAQNWKKFANLLPNEQTSPRLRSAFRIGIAASIILAGLLSYMATTYS